MNKTVNTKTDAVHDAEAESVFRKFQHAFPLRILIKGFLFSTKYLPVGLLRIVGIFFVLLFILLNFKNYIAIRQNLSRIKPGLSAFSYSCMAFAVFKNYSYYLIDLFHLSHDPERVKKYDIKITGLENLEIALSQKKGIIFLTTHLGNWEIGGLKLSSRGREINVVYSPDSMSLLEIQRSFIRFAEGINEIPLRQGEFSSLKMLRILQEGRIIALQGDRLTFDSGVKMSFFGSIALFPKGPVKLAIVSESLIIPVFIPIKGYKSYEIIIEQPVVMEKSEDPEVELKTNLTKIIKILEKYISRYPTQWYTFMPFWVDDLKRKTKRSFSVIEDSSDLP